jgi:predicted nucleic acid-binding protein
MTPWFADTYYFLALRNPKDLAHGPALKLTRKHPRRKLITTAWVLTEVADALASPENRSGFSDLLARLQSNRNAKIIGCTQDLFDEGVTLYRNRPDKAWSLTDCISFVVMQREELTDALTGDHHFEQAGFKALLK